MLLRDLSTHGVLRASGADRVRFLNGMFTNDVAKLEAGHGLHAAMLTVKGKLLGDALILCDAEAFLVDVVPDARAMVRQNLQRHLIVDDVLLEEEPGALGVLGDARTGLESAVGPLPTALYDHVRRGGLRVAVTRDLGLDGFRVYGDTASLSVRLTAGGAAWLSEERAEVLRVEAGEPRYGVDMGEEQLPMEARLDDAVSLVKGCYMGQEVIARLSARGHINKRLVGLRLAGERPAERGARVSGPGREDAGIITSAVRSPRFGSIALGYLHRSLWSDGTTVTVHEPAGPRTATVVELPFGPPSIELTP